MDTSNYLITCELTDAGLAKVKALLDELGNKYSTAILMKDIPGAKQLVFRFELFFDGQYQSVGLLQGLEDACGPVLSQKLTKQFKDELPIPLGITETCSFWFTEKGLRKFATAIDEINAQISRKGWEVRGSFLWVHETDILYEDDLQVAIGTHAFEGASFFPLSRAEALIRQAEEYFHAEKEGS